MWQVVNCNYHMYPAPIVPTITQKNNIQMVGPFLFRCIRRNIIFILLRGPARNLAQVGSVHPSGSGSNNRMRFNVAV
jgi:hypothetical protein